MPTLRSRSVINGALPSPGAASTSPTPPKKAKTIPGPTTPATHEEHGPPPPSPGSHSRRAGSPKRRATTSKKNLRFAQQDDAPPQSAGRGRKRSQRGGGGESVSAMEVENVVSVATEVSEAAAVTVAAEKGKRKLVEVISDALDDGSALNGDGDPGSDFEDEVGTRGASSAAMEMGESASNGSTRARRSRLKTLHVDVQVDNAGGDEPSPHPNGVNKKYERRGQKFLEIARRRAAHFAHFSEQEGEAAAPAPASNGALSQQLEQLAAEQKRQAQTESARPGSGEQDEWHGPFAIARQLIEGRADAVAAAAVNKAQTSGGKAKSSVGWTPSRQRSFRKNRVATALHNMCVEVLCANIECVQSLQGVTEVAKKLISARLCAQRLMTPNSLKLYLSSEPSEVIVPDCTFVTEEALVESLAKVSTQRIEVLELGMCGRALSDQVCTTTLAGVPSSLKNLHTLILTGAYRLTDVGLKALVDNAPNLVTLSLKKSNMFSPAGLEDMSTSVGPHLRALSLESCTQLDAAKIVRPIMKMCSLESLSLAGLSGMTDEIVCEVAVALGSHLKEFSISECRALTDSSVRAIAACCVGLKFLDIGHLPLLTDGSIGSLADGCRSLRTLRLDRGKFSDTALAALITASGNCLTELSLNSVRQVGDFTVSALAKHSKETLDQLDLSFCRNVSDQALGLLADTCPNLRELRLFGCTQVTELFLDGHSNPLLNVIGLPGTSIDLNNSTQKLSMALGRGTQVSVMG